MKFLTRLLGLLAALIGVGALMTHFETDSALMEYGRNAICIGLIFGGGWLLSRKSKQPV